MSAPTLWEEGRMSGSRVTRLAVAAGLVVLVLDIAISRHVTWLFDLGFVVVCVAAALAVHPRDFFHIGVMPPLLLVGLLSLAATVHAGWIGGQGDGFVQAVVAGLAHRATGLLAAYLLTLGVLAIRHRIMARRKRAAYSKREGSPAPTRVTTAGPSERSTTVVGSEPHSPESITASNQ